VFVFILLVALLSDRLLDILDCLRFEKDMLTVFCEVKKLRKVGVASTRSHQASPITCIQARTFSFKEED
jgi:hypothetical protein